MTKSQADPLSVSVWSKLHWASYRGDAEAVAELLERGVDLGAEDRDGWTVLHCAAAGDPSGECVKLLMAAGTLIHSRIRTGATALHVAVGRGNGKVVQELVAAGADVGALDYKGKTPMQYASSTAIKDLLNTSCNEEVPCEITQ